METPVRTLDLDGVLSESKRIFRANYSHFLALSFLFLPLSFSLIINPTLSLSSNFFTSDHFRKFSPNHQKPVVSNLLYILIVYVVTLCAIATITYSTYHSFSGKPIKFFAALKSLTISFFPLVSTAYVALSLLFLISLTFLLFVGVFVMLGQNLGFVLIDYNSIHFTWFSAVVGATLIVLVLYFHMNWSLAFVVVVAESKWGFAPLIRSWYLVKGMRSVSLWLLLYFGVFLGCTVWVNSNVLHAMSSQTYALLPMILGSSMLMWFLLWSTAANTVLYMYCKTFHGELAIKMADGLAHNYINLPFDDEKAPHAHVVTVVAA
ncbi:unnamed protein product [Lactuca virosa]|uniref:Transmembrane protein n=1 Tax=Lactuca virosa TaxID=75947 RepID=A0AAU9N3N1_9ASTR|nr:unnamed protein product [Lactuca virosa]